jgi:hypothetical protein
LPDADGQARDRGDRKRGVEERRHGSRLAEELGTRAVDVLHAAVVSRPA